MIRYLLSLVLLIANLAWADTSITETGKTFGNITLKRLTPTAATVYNSTGTQADCRTKASADALSKADGNYTYSCLQSETDNFTVAKTTACPTTMPDPVPVAATCVPSGTFGTYPAMQAFTLHPQPQCWQPDGDINPPIGPVPPCSLTAPTGVYETAFPGAENPISEGGMWIGPTATWTTVKTTPGRAYGTQSGSRPGNMDYTDSVAINTSVFTANQHIEGTIYLDPNLPVSFREVELWVHATYASSKIKGYEVNFGWGMYGGNSPYVSIVRWDGLYGQFTQISPPSCALPHPPVTGDIVTVEIVGNKITVWYKNTGAIPLDTNHQVCTATDGTYTSGNPGIGFYIDGNYGAPNIGYGFSHIKAMNLQ